MKCPLEFPLWAYHNLWTITGHMSSCWWKFWKLFPELVCYLGDRLRKHLVFPMAVEYLKSFLPTCTVKSNTTHTLRKEKKQKMLLGICKSTSRTSTVLFIWKNFSVVWKAWKVDLFQVTIQLRGLPSNKWGLNWGSASTYPGFAPLCSKISQARTLVRTEQAHSKEGFWRGSLLFACSDGTLSAFPSGMP